MFDAIGDEAGKIGELLKSKETEAKQKNNAEKLNELDAIREQAHLAMRDTSKEMTHMQFFATRTNIFLGAEGAEIDKKEARVLAEMLKPEYIKVLIEKAQWQKAPELVKTGLPEVTAILKTGKETILPRIHGNLDAFLQNPKGQLKKFVLALNANTEFQGKKFTTDDPQVMLLTLRDAEWIDADDLRRAEAPAAPEKKNVSGKPKEGWKYLNENQRLMKQALKTELKAFLETPEQSWRQLRDGLNAYAQNAGTEVEMVIGDEQQLLELLVKADWIDLPQARKVEQMLKEPIPVPQRPAAPANVVPPKQGQRPAETPIQTNPQRPPIPEKPQWQQVPRETDPVGDPDLTRFVRGKEYEVGVARIITIWNPTTNKNLGIDSSEFKDPAVLGKKLKGTGIRITPKAMAAGYTIEFCYPGRYYVSMSNGRLAGTPQLVTVSPSDLPGAPIVTPKQEQQSRGGNRQPTISNAPNPTPLEETVQEETLPPSTPVRPMIPGSKGMDTPPPPPPPTEQEERVPGVSRMEEEVNDEFQRLLDARHIEPNADKFREIWNRYNKNTDAMERIRSKKILVARMKGDKFEEMINRKDEYVVTVPLDLTDASDRGQAVMLYSKPDPNGFQMRLIYIPATQQWYSDNMQTTVEKYGIVVETTMGKKSYGKEYIHGLTFHFKKEMPFIVEKRGVRYDPEMEMAKLEEAKSIARDAKGPKWTSLTNGKPGVEYWYDNNTQKLYAKDVSKSLYMSYDAEGGAWEYLSPIQLSKVERAAHNPEMEKGKVEEAKQKAENHWNFNLDSAKRDDNGKKYGYFYHLDDNHENPDDVEKTVYAVDPTRRNFYFWHEGKSNWQVVPVQDTDKLPKALFDGFDHLDYKEDQQLPKRMRKMSKKPAELPKSKAALEREKGAKSEGPKKESEKKTISPEKAKKQFDALWKKWESLKKETDTVLTGKTEPQSKRLKIEAEEQVLGQFFQEEAFQEPQFADRMGQIQKRIEKLRAERKTLDM